MVESQTYDIAQLLSVQALREIVKADVSLFFLAGAVYNSAISPIGVTNARTAGGQFIIEIQALPGSPYDGHTLTGQI